MDNDGFPDLLFVTQNGGKSSVRLFMNADGGKGKRRFDERFDDELSKIENAVGAAYFDLYEDVSIKGVVVPEYQVRSYSGTTTKKSF